ncbi:Mannosyl-glycoprotein endo-beta-N-acetylglucosaminidase [Geosporobacter subterraneus DSM 17957]|uniref:Mannosyl-glycoprotein endo-beta-N-acetylglucosaminidase n=1 Tax=Geosporobacter subterraneus DSM 17957 TaxID=1121919 RepID=A0A1M6L6L5_9FIRM|nr:N-acetylmuramoyl-L-alanine amidase [Geosporobacter subterraneus]SHJ66830.1 Mannosyl-glycoprotein endo-beta-N-acetylglucosaminidase [Geosporobacter subterraneus DSM 17957]
MKIIIDSGHGGKDSGASGFGVKEKDLNLVYARLLAVKLENYNIEVDRSLINDHYYSPDELTDKIKKSGADICISCHNNAANGAARGFEVIHSIHSQGTLAKLTAEEVRKTGFPVRRVFSRESTAPSRVGQDYYYIIRGTYPTVETIIVEFGFMDNGEDFKLLTDPAWQDRLTAAVAAGIDKYINSSIALKTRIQGNSILLPEQLKAALKAVNSAANTSIVDTYYRIAPVYGIKADLAFLQAVHETNWLRFTGVVKPEQNNFAGLGATGPSNPGLFFPTAEAGVEAHIQHLYAYAATTSIPEGRTLYDKRFHLVRRGSVTYWEDLNGKWAVPGIGYGERIVELQRTVAERYPLPDKPVTPEIPSTPHWAKVCHDELRKAGLLLNDHIDTIDQPATKGVVFCLVNNLRKELIKNE